MDERIALAGAGALGARTAAKQDLAAPTVQYFGSAAQVTGDAPYGRPQATVNLATDSGIRLVRGEWRYSDARVAEVSHRLPGPDLEPSGLPGRTYDIAPHAGGADFDDSRWPVIAPATLDRRRSTGKLSFAWYRLRLTIPERVGALDAAGSTVVFEIVVDDYAEVWVDGELPVVPGQTGGKLVKGFNAPNRVVLTRDARPGQRIQLAIFGINGPLSDPPFGLPKAFDDPRKELPFSGIYRVGTDGAIQLLARDLTGPNGIAFCRPRAPAQPGLGRRRRAEAVPRGADGTLSHPAERARHPPGGPSARRGNAR